MSIKLSICIPTFNRSEKLEELLCSIANSKNVDFSEIEVCVSDNCSSDGTREVLNRWQKDSVFRLKVNFNDENIGAERNFFKVLEMSEGKHVTLMGSDDLYPDNALNSVFSYINRDFDFIFLDIKTFINSPNEKLDDRFSFEVNSNVYFLNKNEILSFFGTELNYISSLFIKREYYLSDFKNEDVLNELHEYGFSYIYKFLSLLPQSLNGVFIKDMHILNRSGEYDVWYDHKKYFLVGMGKVLNLLRMEGYSEKTIKKAKYKNLKKYIGFKKFTVRNFFAGYRYYYNVPYYYLYMIFMLVPDAMLNSKSVKGIYRMIKGI